MNRLSASATPIACSNRSPMAEVIEDARVLFDLESSGSIASVIETLARDPELRARSAERARALAAPYNWQHCSDQTLAFLAEVARTASSAREGRQGWNA